jgi:plasmid stabilization system protein ParE
VKSIRIRPLAGRELREAIDWYESKQDGLGSEFMSAVDRCLDRIALFPSAYSLIYRDIRRATLRRFPYCVFYVVEPDGIVVIAVLHGRREPEEWQRRRVH